MPRRLQYIHAQIASLEVVHRETVNHKQGLCVPRSFLQARLVKPVQDAAKSATAT
jgi:hypothetical protein